MAGPSFKARITAAFKAIRFGGRSGYAMSYGGNGYGGYPWSKNVNYAVAVGDALDNSIVAATVGWIGRTFPEAPIRVVTETTSGEEVVPAHPLTLKLRQPNPYYSGALMWMPVMMSYILDGNAYLLKERTNGGDVLNLWYVPHWTMEPRWNSSFSYVDYYDYKVDGTTKPIDARDVVHLRNGIDPRNTRKGLSQIKSVIREIYSDNMATQYSAAMLSNYGTPGMILSPPANSDKSITPEAAGVMKQNIIEKTTGDRRGEPIIMLDPIDVKIPTFAPNQMNVRESQWTPEERVSAVIGVPAIVVGLGAGLNRSTFANYEQSREAAYQSYLVPVQRVIAADLTTQLLIDFGGKPDERVEFDYSEVSALNEDADAVAKRAGLLFSQGIIDRARALAMIGEESQPTDKDVFFLARGGSFSSGAIAEPVTPSPVQVNTEPAAQISATNGHSAEPVPATTA